MVRFVRTVEAVASGEELGLVRAVGERQGSSEQ